MIREDTNKNIIERFPSMESDLKLHAIPQLNKNKEDIIAKARKWIKSDRTYTIRYGMGVMMRLFLDEDFKEEYIQLVAGVKSEEYYVNMMIAWYMATALAKQWDAAIPYIQEHRLSEWVHRKSIQKAVESYRITPEQKEYLKGLR